MILLSIKNNYNRGLQVALRTGVFVTTTISWLQNAIWIRAHLRYHETLNRLFVGLLDSRNSCKLPYWIHGRGVGYFNRKREQIVRQSITNNQGYAV